MVMTWTKNMDRNVGAQLEKYFSQEARARYPFVTISRQFGCDGVKLANLVVDALNKDNEGKEWFILTRELLLQASDSEHLTDKTLEMLEKFGHSDMQSYIREAFFGMGNQVATVRKMAKVLRLFAERGKVVFLGGGAPILTRDMKMGVHVHLYADLEWRVMNHAKRWSLDEAAARKKVVTKHGEREAFIKTFMGEDINHEKHYMISFNNATINVEVAAELIAHYVRSLKV